ncbi:MAG: hypothetical protein KKD53_04580, partial [Proteobacteria bacterium]|nr:hypothetical protein [Pseudomonadota bacterium]
LAAQHDLLHSGGTDYHGDKHSVTPLGGNTKTIRVPLQFLQDIKQRLAANSMARTNSHQHSDTQQA